MEGLLNPDRDDGAGFYLPYSQHSWFKMSLVVTTATPEATSKVLQVLLQERLPDRPINPAATIASSIDDDLLTLTVISSTFDVLGASALGLAAMGVFGLVSFCVSRRRREIGIRIAVGAQRSAIWFACLRQVGFELVLGLVAGSALAWAMTRVLGHTLGGLPARDPVAIGLAICVLSIVGLGALTLPAWRATLLNPMIVLREE
jgi:ABC-type antimicrobial peptide transport system permease subunit